MKRGCIPMLAVLLLLASATAWAAPAAENRSPASPVVVSGVYSVTFNLNIATPLPAGTTVTCKAEIAPNAAAFEDFDRTAAVVPVQTATGAATVTGSTAVCAVEIPFSWTVNHAQNGVALSYQIEAAYLSGSMPVVVQSSAQRGIGLAYPSAGGTASLIVNAVF